jgi:hypothetical protein
MMLQISSISQGTFLSEYMLVTSFSAFRPLVLHYFGMVQNPDELDDTFCNGPKILRQGWAKTGHFERKSRVS